MLRADVSAVMLPAYIIIVPKLIFTISHIIKHASSIASYKINV